MPQIHNRVGLGELLGTGLGQGISSGLQLLAQNKIQEMAHRNQQIKSAQAFRDLGFGSESLALAQLPEKLQSDIIKNYWQRGGGGIAQPQSTGVSALQEALGLPGEQNAAMFNQEVPEVQSQALQQQPVAPTSEQKFAQSMGVKDQFNPIQDFLVNAEQQHKAQEAKKAEKVAIKNAEKMARIVAAGKKVPQQLAEAVELQKVSQKKPSVAEVLARPYDTPEMKQKERHFQAVEARELRKIENQEQREAYKRTEEVRKKVTQGAESARKSLHDLDRIEELSSEGKLDTPGYVEFLHRSGLDVPALMNPQSEEFAKIQQGFLKDAKQYFGGRVSNYEVEQFLKTIPSLSQSPEGRNRVIANLKYLERAKLEQFKTLREIIKENKGIPPYDLEEQTFERLEPKLDTLSKKFREDLRKPVPKGQNKLITALQATAGSGVGKSGKLLKGALGALAGSRYGPVGAAVGGLGGLLLE